MREMVGRGRVWIVTLGVAACAHVRPPCEATGDPWVDDFNQLVVTVGNRHADAFEETTREDWLAQAEAACGALSSATPDAARVAMIAQLALVGDGHSYVSLHDGAAGFRRYPIWPYRFDDEVRVLAAAEPWGELVGAEIVRIAGRTPEELEQLVAPLVSHSNEAWLRRMAPRFYTTVEVMAVLGLADPDEGLAVEVVDGDGTRTVRLPPDDVAHRAQALVPELAPERFPAAEGWVAAAEDGRRMEALEGPDTPWFVREDDGLVHVKIHSVRNAPGYPFRRFWREEVAPRLEQADALVVDVRFNTGGDFTLTLGAMADLWDGRLSEEGRLFVITDRETFSAAQMTAYALVTEGDATHVGEEVGDTLSSWWTQRRGTLRHSGIPFTWSAGRPLYGDDRGGRLLPDVEAPLTWEAWLAGEDPALDAVRARIP